MTISFEVTNCLKPLDSIGILATLGAYLGAGPCTGIVTMQDLPNAWCVRLAGKPSNPAAGIAMLEELANAGLFETRWFYVQWYDGNNLAVKARQPDEYTLAVMEGWAKFATRYWQGRLELP